MPSEVIPKHGWANTRFYKNWASLSSRCGRKKNYLHVKIAPRWKLFSNFMADMFDSYSAHEKKYGYRNTTLERINSKGDYSPENCRWATYAEQNTNTARNAFVTYKGVTDTMLGWSRRLGLSPKSLYNRLKYWPLDEAMKHKDLGYRLHSRKGKIAIEARMREGKVC